MKSYNLREIIAHRETDLKGILSYDRKFFALLKKSVDKDMSFVYNHKSQSRKSEGQWFTSSVGRAPDF